MLQAKPFLFALNKSAVVESEELLHKNYAYFTRSRIAYGYCPFSARWQSR